MSCFFMRTSCLNFGEYYKGVFNSVLNKAIRDVILSINPMKDLTSKEKLKPSDSLREFITIEELGKIVLKMQ